MDNENSGVMFIERFADAPIASATNNDFEEYRHVSVWGIFKSPETSDHDPSELEFVLLMINGNTEETKLGEAIGLYAEEREAMVRLDDSQVPDEVWAALARYRLTGKVTDDE